MNKEKKEELKKLFSIIDEKKFLRFAKSYAGKNDAFADVFTEEQKETIEKSIYDSIMDDATHSKTDKEYYGIKYGIEKLSKVRPAAHAKAVTLRNRLIALYPRKPLSLSILRNINF